MVNISIGMLHVAMSVKLSHGLKKWNQRLDNSYNLSRFKKNDNILYTM